MPEVPPELAQDFVFERDDTRLREQGTPQFVVWNVVLQLMQTPRMSNRSADLLTFLEDVLHPLENDLYKDALKALKAEEPIWFEKDRSGMGWEKHRRRAVFRILLNLAYDTGLYGRREVFDEDKQI